MSVLQLYPYQEAGVDFLMQRPVEMARKPHRLLADEQGLGKTPQAIVAMVRLSAQTGLIICPASVKYNWARKMVEWGLCAKEHIFIVRTGSDTIPSKARFIVVNYDLAIVPKIHRQLMARKFSVCVLDECHRLKNMNAQRSKLVLGSKLGVVQRAFWKFLLSGTPVPNRPIEFYIVLRTLCPELIEPYTKWVDFGRHFCSGYPSKFGEVDRQTGKQWNFKGASNIVELRERIAPFMLRRELKDVYRELPDMVENIVYLDVDINSHPEVQEQMKDQRVARTEAFNAELEMPQPTIRRIIGECKVPQAIEYITERLDSVPKLMVFAYHQNVINALEQGLEKFQPVVIKGGVSAEQKDERVQAFVRNPKKRVVIAQIVAGGEGIDGLQKVCSDLIYVEIDWSEGGMRQTKSRLHRIGQTEIVKVTYLLADESLETVMSAVLERKSSVINQLMKGKTLMSIEQQLERIANALEAANKLLSTQTGGKAEVLTSSVKEAPSKETAGKTAKTPGKNKAKGPSAEDVRLAAKAFVEEGKGSKADAKKIIKKTTGVDSLAEVDESQYQDLIDAFAEAEPADVDDDGDDI